MKFLIIIFTLFLTTSEVSSFHKLNESFTDQGDSTIAKEYYVLGDSLHNAGDLPGAINALTQAAQLYESASDSDNQILALIQVSECYNENAQYKLSEDTSLKALKINESGPKSQLHEAKINKLLGIVYEQRDENFDKAQEYFERALFLNQRNEGVTLTNLSNSYNDIGVILLKKGSLSEAEGYFKQGNQVLKGADDPTKVDFYNSLYYLGVINIFKQEYDSCLYYYSELLDYLKTGDKQQIKRYHVLNNIGYAHTIKGNNKRALEAYHEALKIAQGQYRSGHHKIGETYNNLANIYRVQGDYKNALEYTKRAIEIAQNDNQTIPSDYLEHLAGIYYELEDTEQSEKVLLEALAQDISDPLNRIDIYTQLGDTYSKKENFDLAISYFNRAKALKKELDASAKFVLPNIHIGLGEVYFKQKDYKTAIKQYEKAIELLERHFEKQPTLALAYFMLGESYLSDDQTFKALDYLQKSISANLIEYNDLSYLSDPSPKNYLNGLMLLDALALKSNALIKLGNGEALEQASNTYAVCDTLIQDIRKSRTDFKDKRLIIEKAKSIYSQAIDLNHQLFNFKKEEKHLAKAFYFSEQNKSILLTESLSSASNDYFLMIPDSIARVEDNLNSDIFYYENELMSQKSLGKHADAAQMNKLKEKIFILKRRRDQQVNFLEINFPNYYQIKYNTKSASLVDIQSKLLDNNHVFIEYFLGDTNLYIFAISKTEHKLKKVPIDSAFHYNFDLFQKRLVLSTLTEQTLNNFKEYTYSSYYLYTQLLAPIEDFISGKNLLITPDDKLALIPFETLLTKAVNIHTVDYSKLPYLLKSNEIGYANSATLLLKSSTRKSKSYDHKGVLAFAPKFSSGARATLAFDTLRSALSPLEWTEKEISSLSEHFNSDNYFGNEATETLFKMKNSGYDIIHIASHSLVDDQNPMYSKIAFSLDDTDTINDGFLHTFELYNMKLNAEMVVLSACNTGYGKVQKGEGVMSLGYAFAYAGVPSTVISHWQVDDKSTYLFMDSFYSNLAEGQNKNEALRNAKLALLNGDNIAYANPYYWGAFVTYGPDISISSEPYNYWWYMALFLTIGFGIFYAKRKGSERRVP